MRRVTARMLKGARMLAGGMGPQKVADALGVDDSTVHRWMKDPDVLSCYREAVARRALGSYAKATIKIDEQLGSENPWVAQGAAREVLARFGPAVMGVEDKAVTVRVEGMPTIGMPSVNEPDAE